MHASPDVDTLIQRLLADDVVDVGDCRLMRNPHCDCILGTDPLGVDAVAAFSACARGCRDAIGWAIRASRAASPTAARCDPVAAGAPA